MTAVRDLSGQRFGRWLVVGKYVSQNGLAFWPCQCDCGAERLVRSAGLVSGKTTSCGCYRADWTKRMNAERARTHVPAPRRSRPPEYSVWLGMKDRCFNPAFKQWDDYGGRGITVCERWRKSFAAFYDDMGRRPSPEHQLDRIDNDGDYEPGNVRWATPSENCNNKSNNRLIAHGGQTRTLTEWSREAGLPLLVLLSRIDRLGWAFERALSEPVRSQNKGGHITRVVQFAGRSMTVREWAEEMGIRPHTLATRIGRYGWSVERALTTPVRKAVRPPRT